MQQSVIYTNANIAMQIAKFLLTREKIRTMAGAADFAEIHNVLSSCGYNADLPTDDEIIDAERAKTLKTFCELSTEDEVSFCVRALHTKHELHTQIAAAHPNATSAQIDALTETELFKGIEPHINKIKNKNIREYFVALADLTNIKTFAKHRAAGIKPDGVFVAGGRIGTAPLSGAFAGDGETLRSLFIATPYTDIYTALVKSLDEKDLNILEDAASAHLDRVAAADKDDLFRPNLLFWWFCEKQKEFIAVKTIVMNKRLGFPPSVIRDNLRGLYERFQ
jgi:vacuolar-type H+-ATPase subunit C/Vma6